MPRRAWVADLQKLQQNVDIAPHIIAVRSGSDDGEVIITISPDGTPTSSFDVCALIPDLGDYPSGHVYQLFAADNAPAHVGTTLEQASTSCLSLAQLCSHLSRLFDSGTSEDSDVVMIDSQLADEEEDSDDDFGGYESDELFSTQKAANTPAVSSRRRSSGVTPAFRQRIRNDLRLTKEAGFRVGHHAALMEGGSSYVSVSVRVNKLGISEEATQAWQLTGKEYLILLIHFSGGYRTLDDMDGLDAASTRTLIDFRVGCSDVYKPTITETISAFTHLAKPDLDSQDSSSLHGFRDVFISKALNQLFNERFAMILRYRGVGLTWTAAENFYNRNQGKSMSATGSDFMLEDCEELEEVTRPFPEIVLDDHFTTTAAPRSLPLVAMQFLLRHFVRCTEFCLVCHCKLPGDLEAIKPYVCEGPLCLYQYMSLGFGPSIEHEILTQPYVVDLLLSFCVVSAMSSKLKDLPNGLSLSVPPMPGSVPDKPTATGKAGVDYSITAKWYASVSELVFDKEDVLHLKAGDWIVLNVIDLPEAALHCRVMETTYFPVVTLSKPVIMPELGSEHLFNPTDVADTSKTTLTAKQKESITKIEKRLTQKEAQTASFVIYRKNFDDIPAAEQQKAVASVIQLIPRVHEMKDYLTSSKSASLASWIGRLSPAAVGILRWVIASNRACIMQSTDNGTSDNRVYGMKGWLEFRFAMGAPDKERRFINAVNSAHQRLGQRCPTMFAFHGSPLHNWHSIIRQGLHFNDIAHGRAYGNGVYHSLDYHTSAGYSGHYHHYGAVNSAHKTWLNSDLQIQTAMAVNELVNSPTEFVSRTPHLVVAQLDWIQTRFLFVRIGSQKITLTDVTASTDPFPQDANMTPKGEQAALVIPRTAIPRGKVRTVVTKSERRGTISKLLKSKKGDDVSNAINVDEGYESAATDMDDVQILEDSDDETVAAADPVAASKTKTGILSSIGKSLFAKQESKTDFVPGVLDYSTLPMMADPSYSTPAASKRLQKEFQGLVKIQETTPLDQLGWYTNPEKFNNVYQWIVELHTFDESLLLVTAMKQHKIKSVVLEMRFGPDFPMSPPFVRVIRPRFVPFQQGGGGHVTAGGSLCMELLTNSGWRPVASIESVLMSIRVALSDTARPAKLDTHSSGSSSRDYGIMEAVDAYERACRVHGWTIPPGFRKMALEGSSSSSLM